MKKVDGPEATPTIAERLRRINLETSSHLAAMAAGDSPRVRGGRVKILALAFGAFVKAFVMQKNFARGKEGFISSGAEAMEAIVQAVKVWELAFRRSEGSTQLPPATEAEVKKQSVKYASWTAS